MRCWIILYQSHLSERFALNFKPLVVPVYSTILFQRLLLATVVLQEFPDVQAGFHASKISVKEVGKSFNMDRLSSNQLGVQVENE